MAATRAALVVGAHQFADPRFQRLRSPSEDVDALAAILGDETIGGFEVRTVENEPNSVVQQELERFFSGRKPEDLLFLYFSCHGVKDPTGRLYFVTSNTSLDLLRSTGISASFVSEQMEYSRSKRIVVLLDCCYSGAFLKGFRARGGDDVAVAELEGRGRAVITASRATEYAFEADELTAENAQPSMFTGAVVEGLATGGADRNGDGLVTVDELYDYVYDAVRGKVAGQTPGRWIDVEGDLVVARNPRPPVRAASVPFELERAIASDLALQRLGAVTELAQWYRSADPERQLAAAPLLDQLSRDYDERVKGAALAALSVAPEPAPAAVVAPIPVTAPTEPEPEPAPAPEPVRASAPESSSAAPAAPVHAAAGRAITDTEDVGVTAGRRDRVLGVAAAIGGLGLLLAPYFDFLYFDGTPEKLSERGWYTLGTWVWFGLAVYAADCIVRTSRRSTGHAVLVGLLPLSAGEVLFALDRSTEDGVTGAGLGWVLDEVGALLLVVVGVVAALRLRREVSLSPPDLLDRAERSQVATAVAALFVGWAAVIGWAQVFDYSGDGGFLDAAGPVRALAFRLLLLAALACLGGRWVAAHRSSTALVAVGTLAVSLCVGLFLGDDEVVSTDNWVRAVEFVVIALGAAVIPPVAAIIVPRSIGVTLLAAWAVPIAAWLPYWSSNDVTIGLLAVALGAGAVLAAAMLRLPARHPQPT